MGTEDVITLAYKAKCYTADNFKLNDSPVEYLLLVTYAISYIYIYMHLSFHALFGFNADASPSTRA